MRQRFFWSVSTAGLLLRVGVLVGVLLLARLNDLPV
jgi:hypothetical protein